LIFKNTVVIMTSNIGSDILLEGYKGGDEIAEDVREKVLARLKSHFRPEFLNRVDETIMFKPLTMEEVGKIVTKLIADLEERLKKSKLNFLFPMRQNSIWPKTDSIRCMAPAL